VRTDAPSRKAARRASPGLLRAHRPRLAGGGPKQAGASRDSGARIVKALNGASRAAGRSSSTRLLFDTSSARATTQPNATPRRRQPSTNTTHAQTPRHNHATKRTRGDLTRFNDPPATYLTRNRTQIPTNARQTTVDFHRSSGPAARWRRLTASAATGGAAASRQRTATAGIVASPQREARWPP
jgi:hypothetical protein